VSVFFDFLKSEVGAEQMRENVIYIVGWESTDDVFRTSNSSVQTHKFKRKLQSCSSCSL